MNAFQVILIAILIVANLLVFSARRNKMPIVEEECKEIGLSDTITEPNSELEQKLIALDLVDIQELDSNILVDLKYSTDQNFIGEDVYGNLEKCYLQRTIAQQLLLAQAALKNRHPDYNLLVFDGVRPLSTQVQMWELVVGTEQERYVATPEKGSMHNLGVAVDLTIADEFGKELDMGTEFDYFGPLAQPRYESKFLKEGLLTEKHIKNRSLLRSVMKEAGFKGINSEWWHFNGMDKEEARALFENIDF